MNSYLKKHSLRILKRKQHIHSLQNCRKSGILIYLYPKLGTNHIKLSAFLLRGRHGFVNIGVTNLWIMELGRIFSKITSFKTFQIRPINKI